MRRDWKLLGTRGSSMHDSILELLDLRLTVTSYLAHCTKLKPWVPNALSINPYRCYMGILRWSSLSGLKENSLNKGCTWIPESKLQS
jgi:hypothetical protein